MIEMETQAIPVHAIPYIFYGDGDGLPDSEIKSIDDYLGKFNCPVFSQTDGEIYFNVSPVFGLACDVEDFTLHVQGVE